MIGQLQSPSSLSPSPLPQPDSLPPLTPQRVKLHQHDPGDSLETSMMKVGGASCCGGRGHCAAVLQAAEDTTVLKSVVVPLEEVRDKATPTQSLALL